ncbi:hypothetical protein CDL15_Pgr025253 [Punica granatum]|uniref:indole-3-acetaldehyde oxidase n=1 Tax=Punica granatum TaxID=22663 RepID=A0A218W8U4_PUNGR|nr:hypothetical protein CDL15_Pgr025253 [Punica granatum]
MSRDRNLVFAVNGQRFELSDVDPSTTVLEFLRLHTGFKSVKLGCGEGGCGACLVLLSRYDPASDRVEDYTVSSCLTLLCGIGGCSITTTEGLGNTKDGFHPIHKRFSGFHASQCGFCTPGMCISLYGALVNAEKTDRPEPTKGFSKLTVSEAERAISGNLCRCTGYRPIADACKSFAADVDIEDLGLNTFWRKGEDKEASLSRLPPYDQNTDIRGFPEFLKEEVKASDGLGVEKCNWYSPVTLDELQCLFGQDGMDKGHRVKLVVGNTSVGYYKENQRWDRYIDLRHIPELQVITKDKTGIEIGAAVTITKSIKELRDFSECLPNLDSGNIFRRLADHAEKVASWHIRNSGSLGGNLVMAQREKFPSDIVTVLLAAGSSVHILAGSKHEIVTLDEFLKRPPLDSKSLLLSVKIPIWESRSSKILFETYRAAPRPLGNALPYLNAAFLAEVSQCDSSKVIHIKSCRMVFGAHGHEHAVRARRLEEVLVGGRALSLSLLREAIEVAKETVVPEDGISSPDYRRSLAAAFVFKFLVPLIESTAPMTKYLDGYANYSLAKDIKQDRKQLEDVAAQLSYGKQVIEVDKQYSPVGEPVKKSLSTIQASGEAVYVDDIPSPTNCLYGAFIYSTKPLARVKGIRFSPRLPKDAVISVVSFLDIPAGGENLGSRTVLGNEALFSDELAHCAGDRVAFVVAESQKNADLAAEAALIDYDTEDLEPPILSVEDAVERSSFFEVPSFLQPKQVGNFSEGMAEADHKILSARIQLGSQYYFYLENQSALAIPDEDNCMVIYSSMQCPEFLHGTVARCLGVPEHNIRVITRRVGGGFGGKSMRSMPVATACAVAAQKLNRPVRTYLNRKTDMILAGGRHPMKITYSVGFKSNGKITALHLDVLINAGLSADISPIVPQNIVGALKKYNWGSLSFEFKVCKTNHTSKSAMRAPGEVQGSFIAEVVIEHVASALLMEPDAIRNVNIHTYDSLSLFYGSNAAGAPKDYTGPSIWSKLDSSSDLARRAEEVKEFNIHNKWIKRGISRVPVVYEVTVRPTPGKVSVLSDGSVVVEVGGTELGQGLWTKVKQMVAFGLGLIQCDGSMELLEKVRVVQTDTLSVIQGGWTAGSTTSEANCQAVKLCCDTLVERLRPLRDSLREQMGSVTWEVLIEQAYLQFVSLSASAFYCPESILMRYLNYGAAVEIDVLTGETTILRSDIIYDCGKSLNPAVDLGQIEGAFVQGIGFFMLEEYTTNSEGLVNTNGTWTYKIPTLDTIPRVFNVEVLSSGHHKGRVLSSKASGEPPLLLAASVHCATRTAIKEARRQLLSWSGMDTTDSPFQLDVPATLPIVKGLCGLDSIEGYLHWRMSGK